MDKPHLVYGIATDHTHSREAAQDASSALMMSTTSDAGIQNVGLFVVADGMVGRDESESAAALAVQTVVAEVMRQVYAPLQAHMGDYEVPVRQVLVNAFLAANQRLLASPSYGTTAMTAALVNGSMAYIAHVGDTSAHLITPAGVQQLTTTHHLAHRLVESGQATWEQLFLNQVDVTNVLYRTVGKNEPLEVDVITAQIDPTSQILLCTDGLSGWNWERVPKNEIASVMMSSYDLQFACNRLITLAQERDTIDAVTAILVGVDNH
ncbi:MAG: protein phosphatase 2C domain-containing protein [Chloroflexi bacterium]|nr:protein phosphatase 2C domain-containing protein [Chloroflexota bacterium]MCC6895172.1 serine/threonine-protein phosphatase [Anaerolineae bacterium]